MNAVRAKRVCPCPPDREAPGSPQGWNSGCSFLGPFLSKQKKNGPTPAERCFSLREAFFSLLAQRKESKERAALPLRQPRSPGYETGGARTRCARTACPFLPVPHPDARLSGKGLLVPQLFLIIQQAASWRFFISPIYERANPLWAGRAKQPTAYGFSIRGGDGPLRCAVPILPLNPVRSCPCHQENTKRRATPPPGASEENVNGRSDLRTGNSHEANPCEVQRRRRVLFRYTRQLSSCARGFLPCRSTPSPLHEPSLQTERPPPAPSEASASHCGPRCGQNPFNAEARCPWPMRLRKSASRYSAYPSSKNGDSQTSRSVASAPTSCNRELRTLGLCSTSRCIHLRLPRESAICSTRIHPSS